ncbi:MAG: hypothetical protein E7375_02630 [Clostridiales bacterium]|nr:hypothetical protein [Clostridiales bacterium]
MTVQEALEKIKKSYSSGSISLEAYRYFTELIQTFKTFSNNRPLTRASQYRHVLRNIQEFCFGDLNKTPPENLAGRLELYIELTSVRENDILKKLSEITGEEIDLDDILAKIQTASKSKTHFSNRTKQYLTDCNCDKKPTKKIKSLSI